MDLFAGDQICESFSGRYTSTDVKGLVVGNPKLDAVCTVSSVRCEVPDHSSASLAQSDLAASNAASCGMCVDKISILGSTKPAVLQYRSG